MRWNQVANGRWRGPSRLACGIGLALLLCAQGAAARPTVRDELPSAARIEWDAALELYTARDYRSALERFRKAFEVSKNPRTLYNVGVCWKNLNQYAQAIRVWQEELTLQKRLEAEDVAKAKAAISALEAFVSSLQIRVNEVGATLEVDGLELGQSPFVEPLAVDIGERQVRLTKAGFEPIERKVMVERGRVASLDLRMVHLEKKGHLELLVQGPPDSVVFMDGRELGRGGYSGDVPAGRHTFEARAEGFTTTSQTSEVPYGEDVAITLAMSEAPTEGKVRVVSSHADAQIRVDGRLVGTGAWEGLLPAGGHQVIVSKEGYDERQLEVALNPNQARTVEVDLAPESAWVFWSVSLAAVVAGGTIAAIVLSRPAENPPVRGTFGTTTVGGGDPPTGAGFSF